MKEKLLLMIKLFWLAVIGVISFEYWWNYDYSFRYISVVALDVTGPKMMYLLEFDTNLKLVGEDVYKIVGLDNRLVNKEIKNPIHGATYAYNSFTCLFEMIFEPYYND